MAIALDNAGSVVSNASTTVTLPLTTGAGSNRALVVFAACDTPASNPSATYNGVAMGASILSQIGFIYRIVAFILVAPAAGANNAVVTYDANPGSTIVMGSTWTGVHQTTPNRTPVTTHEESGNTTITATVANAVSGDMVVDGCIGYTGTLTIGAGQTSLVTASMFGGGSASAAHSYEAATGSTVMSETLGSVGLWAQGAFALMPAAAAAALLNKPPVLARQAVKRAAFH